MLLAGAAQHYVRLIWPSKLAVHAPSRSAVRAVGKLGRWEVAEEVTFGGHADLSLKLPSPLMEGHALEAGCVVLLLSTIAQFLRMCDGSEIGPVVIGMNTIAVVHLVVRPLIGDPQMG